MNKRNLLDEQQIRVLGFILFSSPLLDNYDNLAKKLKIPVYLTRKIIIELNEKHWITKKRSGRKLLIKLNKRNIPKYIQEKIEYYIDTADTAFVLKSA